MANGDSTGIDPDFLKTLQIPVTGTTGAPQTPPLTLAQFQQLFPQTQLPPSQTQPSQTSTGSAGSLSQARSNFASELQDPNRRRLLMASTAAEVGGQGSAAEQAYMESVMNRASAEGRSLAAVLLDPQYYPASTKNQLGATFNKDENQRYGSIIDNVLAGSNVSNLATGNESGKVRSGGAQITFDPGTGERFVEENWTKDWRANTLASLTRSQSAGNPPRADLAFSLRNLQQQPGIAQLNR